MRILHTKLSGNVDSNYSIDSKHYACGQRAEGEHYWTGGSIEEWLRLYNRAKEYEPCEKCLNHPLYPLFLLTITKL